MSSNSDSVGMPWERVIEKKVKSSDKEDLGEVQSIGPYYIEVKEGSVRKKRYFIPKHHIQGYDGNQLHTTLTKDEIKDKYERDSPPSESEFRTQKESEYKSKTESMPQYLHAVPFMAKEPGVSLEDKQLGEALNIPWEEVLHKHVRTTDNIDIGDVEKVGNEFIVVREGVAKIHLYYIPKSYISNYDGSYLYISTPSGLVSAKFEKDAEPTPEEMAALAKEAPDARTSSVSKEGKGEREEDKAT